MNNRASHRKRIRYNVEQSTQHASPLPDLKIDKNPVVKTQATQTDNEMLAMSEVEFIKDIVQCVVCLLTPNYDEIYTCSWGHIHCYTCALRILADAVLRKQDAKCSTCRRSMTWKTISKNVSLRHVFLHTSMECDECNMLIWRIDFKGHKKYDCIQRCVQCKNRCIGCKWEGSFAQQAAHESACEFPHKTAVEIIAELDLIIQEEYNAYSPFFNAYKQLSAMNLLFRDLDLKHRYDEMNDKFFMISEFFHAFDKLWQMEVHIIEDQVNVYETSKRRVMYNIFMLSHLHEAHQLHFMITQSPDKPIDFNFALGNCLVGNGNWVTGQQEMHINGITEFNKLIATGVTKVRLWMFINFKE